MRNKKIIKKGYVFINNKGNNMNKKIKEVPIFTATDDNYIPFLAVTLQSMLDNSSKNYHYSVKVLNSGISEENIAKIKKFERDNLKVEFVDVRKPLEELNSRLHTCIYYTQATYYRLFIPSMYPQYDKALYIDCDIVIRADLAKLYNINIGNKLVGATTDEFVMNYPSIQPYFTQCLGLNKVSDYFNAGVLLMNLEDLRKYRFQVKFLYLLDMIKFRVAQDQDYLNRLCKGRVLIIDNSTTNST